MNGIANTPIGIFNVLLNERLAWFGKELHLTGYIVTIIFVVFSLSSSVIAQITITSANVSAINAVGNVLTNHLDTTTTSINIGSPGSTSWNFSALRSHFSTSVRSVTPATTPYISTFPTSNVVFQYRVLFEDDTADGWQYTTQSSTNYALNGVVVRIVIGTNEVLSRAVVNPPQVVFPLPFTYNSRWNNNFVLTNTLLLNGSPQMTTRANHTDTVVVDAYGPMTMPGGAVFQALRLRSDDRYTSDGMSFRTISYTFLASNGAAVEVTARDTTAPNSGVIPVESGITWSLPGSAVNVSNEDPIPSQYFLSQNYPNPFNPSTIIEYHLPAASHVRLKIYDVLGREVATLVNEEQMPGTYKVTIDASGWSSGVYIYRLTAGTFTETRRLVLLR